MNAKTSLATICAAAALLGTAVASSPTGKPEKDEKQGISTLGVSIPWQWLASTGGTMTFQCDERRSADDEGARMIEALSKAGKRGHYAGKGDDGGTFTGTRSGNDFTFEAVSKDGSRFVMAMPWAAAKCIFGGARLAGAGSVDLKAREVAGRLRLEIAGEKNGVRAEVK